MSDGAAVGGRRGYWFPLVLLGFGLLVLLGWDSVRSTGDVDWFGYTPLSSDAGHFAIVQGLEGTSYVSGLPSRPEWFPGRERPWAVLVTATLVATVLFYGRRARGSMGRHVALAVGGGTVVAACYVVVRMAAAVSDPAGLATTLGLPLLGFGALAGAWAHVRRGSGRRLAMVIGVCCLVLGVGVVLGVAPGLLDPVVVAGGLLALARVERSRPLAVVAAAVLVAMVVFPYGTLSTLVPAAIVLVAAVVVLARQGGAGVPRPAT